MDILFQILLYNKQVLGIIFLPELYAFSTILTHHNRTNIFSKTENHHFISVEYLLYVNGKIITHVTYFSTYTLFLSMTFSFCTIL